MSDTFGGFRFAEHGLDSRFAQYTAAVDLATVEQGGAEDSQVFRTGEYAGVARVVEVEQVCQRVVGLSQQNRSVGRYGGGGDQFHDLRLSGCFRTVCGVFHSQDVEDVTLRVVAQEFAGDVLQDVLQGDKVQAAVFVRGFRFEIARHRADVGHQRIGIGFPVGFDHLVGGDVSGKSRSVREQVDDADLGLFARFRIDVRLEAGNVLAHGVGQAVSARFEQVHHRHGGPHDLAARGQVEDRVGGHGYGVGIDALVAVGFEIDQFFVPYHGQYGSRHFALIDGVVDELIDFFQPFGVHTGGFRRSFFQAFRLRFERYGTSQAQQCRCKKFTFHGI